MRKIKEVVNNPKYADVLDILGMISFGMFMFELLLIGSLFG